MNNYHIMVDSNIIAIIPAFNEESTIENIIKTTSRFVKEILVINDGSTDRTAEVAKHAGAVVIDNIVNRGLGKTIKRGYEEAIKHGADIVVQIDADGQYDSEDILRSLNLLSILKPTGFLVQVLRI